MGKKLQIAVKKRMDVEDEARNNGSFNGDVFCSLTWFDFPRFKYGSESQKKKIVKQQLSHLSKNDVVTNMDLEKRELVVVTEEGNHSLDDALFKSDLKMPRHLRTKTDRTDARARFRM